ncbi:flagellar biosynthesis protein FlhF [Paenibacillus sp. UNC451MF]|uniref:flagellar biosynthesis protein FlhF n=1 Tax=Paenibacillus sp. UNC451MF TaxID=1449063 RepID=UPI00048F87FE|nr:flagellar biosynthesis protein FlhF [Paenibacillus sp. UNC451MF]
MRVKRYVVDSMPDALQKIRSDLGKDAVILNTKEIRSGGFLGMFAKKKIEVIAATDSAAAAASPTINKDSGDTIVPLSKPVANKVSEVITYTRPTSMKKSNLSEDKSNLAFPDVPDVLDPEAAPEPKQVPQPSVIKPVQAASSQSRDDLLLQEIKQMKQFMHQLSVQGHPAVPMDPILERLQQRLLDQEVDPEIVDRLIAKAAEEAEAGGIPLTEKHARLSLERQLNELFVTGTNKRLDHDTKVAHFVGPTGVGKTTTIAKLAAEQVLKYHRKVGFITSDTYRIAAVEQLKTYGTILNVPLEVVFSPQDLPRAFEQMKDRDIIFMDTAGRNFRNEMYVSELNALLQSEGKNETFLVLSLTTKYKDMKAIAENFTKFKLDKVLFTKMDETDTYGSIINLANDFQLQTSYVTHGQSVPEDITELGEQQIIDLILGVEQDE